MSRRFFDLSPSQPRPRSARSREFSRRDLMKAAGASLLVPQFVRTAFAQDPAGAAPKLILLMQTNGTSQANFWPGPDFGSTPTLEPIFRDPALKAKATVIKGLFNNSGGLAGNQ